MTACNSAFIARNVVVICPVLADPSQGPRLVGLQKLTAVLSVLAEKVFVISGNFFENIPHENVMVVNIKAPMMKISPQIFSMKRLPYTLFIRVFRYFSTQLALSSAIIRLSIREESNLDAVFVFTGEASTIPIVISKLLGKHTILVLRGSMLRESVGKDEQARKDLFRKPLLFLRRLSLTLSDRIIIYSEGVITRWKLGKYRNKILIAPYLFTDSDKFILEKPLVKRNNLIGYLGNLTLEKGILNFIKAIPILLELNPDTRFLIAGEGELQGEIEHYLNQGNLGDKVRFVGRIDHDKVPGYLNQLKLLVLPSYSEGLPNALLEAMACGAPVLATPVGSIPDIIKHDQTGFIMENSSPECITNNVIRALNHPTLDKISQAARTFVENEYTYEAAVERYRLVLSRC